MNTFRISLLSLALLCAFPFAAKPTAPTQAHAIGVLFDNGGAVLTQGEVKYFTVPYGCTIQAWNMTAVPAGSSVTVDIWKANGQYPTASHSITGSTTPSISGFLPVHSTNLTGWTTTVNQNDTFAFYLSAVGSATQSTVVLQCQ